LATPNTTTVTPSAKVAMNVTAESVLAGKSGNNFSDAATKSESDSDSENESDSDPPVCNLCGQAPCDWEQYGEDIWEECNNMKEQGFEKNAVRYHAYKLYTHMRHGVLCHYNQCPLPVCVRGELMDAWPEADHVYVSLQQAMKDAADVNY
jgi:hypothetical protein